MRRDNSMIQKMSKYETKPKIKNHEHRKSYQCIKDLGLASSKDVLKGNPSNSSYA